MKTEREILLEEIVKQYKEIASYAGVRMDVFGKSLLMDLNKKANELESQLSALPIEPESKRLTKELPFTEHDGRRYEIIHEQKIMKPESKKSANFIDGFAEEKRKILHNQLCQFEKKEKEDKPSMSEVTDYIVRKLNIDGVLDSHGNVKVKQFSTPQSVIPSEEEINKEFPIKTEIKINDEDGIRLRERNYGARYGAKWALSKMKPIDRKDDLIKCCNHLKIVMTRGESWSIESAVNEYLEDK